jgi:hypothetical protein
MIDAESPLMSRRRFPSDQKGPEGTDVMTMLAGHLVRFPLRCLGADQLTTLKRHDLMEVYDATICWMINCDGVSVRYFRSSSTCADHADLPSVHGTPEKEIRKVVGPAV